MQISVQRNEVVNKVEKPNSFSFRYGGVGSEAKIYWETQDDLNKGIEIVLEAKRFLAEKLQVEVKE